LGYSGHDQGALEAALADAWKKGCGKFVLLGDVTDYCHDVQGALAVVRENFDAVMMCLTGICW